MPGLANFVIFSTEYLYIDYIIWRKLLNKTKLIFSITDDYKFASYIKFKNVLNSRFSSYILILTQIFHPHPSNICS